MNLINNILSTIQHSATGGGDGVVGIDIGSSSIKVVELQDRKGIITLTTYGEIQIGPYAGKQIGESVVLDSKQEQEALIDVIRESAVKARNAVFAMPLSSSFVTNVSIEADPDVDLSSLVRVEAKKVIPASLSEITMDWAEVGMTKKESETGGAKYRNVLIAAIQNSAFERYNVLMQFAGLAQPPTEIECFSAIRGLYSADTENIVILDIGATSSKLYITHKGVLVRMYRIRAGGALATKRIAEVLEISFEEAEKSKFSVDRKGSQFSDIKRAHDSSYERTFREFKQVLQEYEQKTGNIIASVHLAGGGSTFPGMSTYLKGVLEKEIIMANPFSKVAYPAFMEDTMYEIGPSFVVALGAAMRQFE